MSGRFNAEQISGQAKELFRHADDLDQQIDGFIHTVEGFGKACGDREPIGMLLGIGLEAAQGVLVTNLEDVVEGYEIIAGKLAATAELDADTEEANRATTEAIWV